MGVLVDNFGEFLRGFGETLTLTGGAALISLVVGVVLAVMRVSPSAPLRWVGTAYVTVFRNTPLVLLFVLFSEGLPDMGWKPSFEIRAIIALSSYASAFICEAVRSGINTIQPGQAEAARAVGMTFPQTVRFVVLPQALRAVIPPIASVLIALSRNTSIASGFGVVEAAGVLSDLGREHAGSIYWIFLGVAVGYMIITWVIAGLARLLERQVAVSR